MILQHGLCMASKESGGERLSGPPEAMKDQSKVQSRNGILQTRILFAQEGLVKRHHRFVGLHGRIPKRTVRIARI
jgi:hypothetical protein